MTYVSFSAPLEEAQVKSTDRFFMILRRALEGRSGSSSSSSSDSDDEQKVALKYKEEGSRK